MGVGVVQSCEGALTYYQKSAEEGTTMYNQNALRLHLFKSQCSFMFQLTLTQSFVL